MRKVIESAFLGKVVTLELRGRKNERRTFEGQIVQFVPNSEAVYVRLFEPWNGVNHITSDLD